VDPGVWFAPTGDTVRCGAMGCRASPGWGGGKSWDVESDGSRSARAESHDDRSIRPQDVDDGDADDADDGNGNGDGDGSHEP